MPSDMAVQLEKVLPTHFKSAVACGRSFSHGNCDDSALITIKSTCMMDIGLELGGLFH